jgi:hypothetical protein
VTHVTRQDLAQGSIETWASWLRTALVRYGKVAKAEERMLAFAPLDIDPGSQSPVGEIVRQIERLCDGPEPAAAAAEVLRTWSPPLEGTPGAALLIQIANQLGSRGLAPAILRLIAKAEEAPLADQDELAFLALEAAADRFKRTEVAELAALMWRRNLVTPSRAADVAMLLARDHLFGLGGLPQAIVLLFPIITDESCEREYIEAIGNRLQLAYPTEELAYAFADPPEPEAGEEGAFEGSVEGNIQWKITRFRKELLRHVAPWYTESIFVDFIPRTDATEEEEVEAWQKRATFQININPGAIRENEDPEEPA